MQAKAVTNKNEKGSEGEDAASEGGEDEVYYDEMEYGDELNDEEERDYKKSLKMKEPVVFVKKDLP